MEQETRYELHEVLGMEHFKIDREAVGGNK
jgi:hypothetical protein